MSKTLGTRPTLDEYIDEQRAEARERGNSTCTLFTVNEPAMEAKLREKGLGYASPRKGEYIVPV